MAQAYWGRRTVSGFTGPSASQLLLCKKIDLNEKARTSTLKKTRQWQNPHHIPAALISLCYLSAILPCLPVLRNLKISLIWFWPRPERLQPQEPEGWSCSPQVHQCRNSSSFSPHPALVWRNQETSWIISRRDQTTSHWKAYQWDLGFFKQKHSAPSTWIQDTFSHSAHCLHQERCIKGLAKKGQRINPATHKASTMD